MATKKKRSTKRPPSPTVPNGGRDGRGRFTKGNPGGPGNPRQRRAAQLAQAIDNALPEGWAEGIALKLHGIVSDEDEQTADRLAAARILLERRFGRPRAATPEPIEVQLGALETLEELRQAAAQIAAAAAAGADPGQIQAMSRVLRDVLDGIVGGEVEERLREMEAWRRELDVDGGGLRAV